ncbi:hypothetical protein COB55_02605 [Candidatus Wolfebacteria bacterium]|nr:MAG: hypothetical protein COB55_02605 [Candidatus Wolfebacteria bacterium]
MHRQYNKGLGVIEVIIGTAIFVIVIGVVSNMYARFTDAVMDNTEKLQATMLVEEGGEVVRILRDNGWDNFIGGFELGSLYYYSFAGSDWSVSTTTPSAYIDGVFLRSVIFDSVYRDGNDVIATSGTLDPDSRKATVNVSWQNGSGTTTQTQIMYISKLFD